MTTDLTTSPAGGVVLVAAASGEVGSPRLCRFGGDCFAPCGFAAVGACIGGESAANGVGGATPSEPGVTPRAPKAGETSAASSAPERADTGNKPESDGRPFIERAEEG